MSRSVNQPLVCSCCGSELTKPQFYKGNMYGYTCINKVAPKQKKSQTVMHPVELVSIKSINNSARMHVVFDVNGKRAAVVCVADIARYTMYEIVTGNVTNLNHNGFVLHDGVAMISDALLKRINN